MTLVEGKHNQSLDILVQLALRYIGVPYIYGGKNALHGFDCSGFISELLHALGAIPFSLDTNSQGLYSYFKEKAQEGVITAGTLAFYGENINSINHVVMFLDTHLVIEAGHGTPQTLTQEIAEQRGSMVRVRPFNYRKDLVAVLRPRYEDLGFEA